jgi:dihydrofolate reductase
MPCCYSYVPVQKNVTDGGRGAVPYNPDMDTRKICLFMMVSLDGYVEGPDHEMNWHIVDEEFHSFSVQQLHATDTLIFGRKTYELMEAFWPAYQGKEFAGTAERMNALPKIVFSRTLQDVTWKGTRLVNDDVAGELRKLKAQPGKDLLILGSNNLCVSLIGMGLLDEVRIMLCPVAIGRGNSLFAGLPQPFKMRLAAARQFTSGNILLTYQK